MLADPEGPTRSARVRGRRDWDRLGERGKDAHYRALKAIGLMRQEGLSLKDAARLAGTTPRTVHRYAEPALTKTGNRYKASLGDRLYRRMAVMTATGRVDVDVRGSRSASLVGSHHNAIQRYLAIGDEWLLAPYRGKRVGGQELLADPARLEQIAAQRELDIDDIYPRS